MTPRWVLHIAGLVVPKVRSNLAVDAGDVRRDRREWSKAAQCYARALRICPDRRPIWVQLGHVRKENGEYEGALAAYRRACSLPGDDDDTHWHPRRLGALVEAKAALREATRRKPDNADLRAELLNETLFTSLAHVREKIAAWVEDYNIGRPHSALGYATPAAFAADLKKQGAASLRIAGGYATQPLASPALSRNNDAGTLIATG